MGQLLICLVEEGGVTVTYVFPPKAELPVFRTSGPLEFPWKRTLAISCLYMNPEIGVLDYGH